MRSLEGVIFAFWIFGGCAGHPPETPGPAGVSASQEVRPAPLPGASVAASAPGTAYTPFGGESTPWHQGFRRYEFVMEDGSLAITPAVQPQGEGLGIKDPPPGQHRCVVVVPGTVADGAPWSWRGCYFNHQPQTEIELLKRGFHVAYISANATLKPGREWDAWYRFLTERHGLSRKPAFVGMSRGGEYAYTWSVRHPGQVACIYADNPGSNPEVLGGLGGLASADVPLFHVCGSIDPLLGRYSNAIESIYRELGGRISVMIKEGRGHHPHSLNDPTPLADFIAASVRSAAPPLPAFAGTHPTRTAFYSSESRYVEAPKEGTFLTCRGPAFFPCYGRYSFSLAGVEGAATVIAPESPAAGMPWVFRADPVGRDAAVDLALLSRGFHLVTGPVPYNKDGPVPAHWDKVYEHLVSLGFSRKPVLEGAGGAAREAYVWATANPDKVACIYAENPFLGAAHGETPLLERLPALASSGVPLLHVCGSLDPAFPTSTRAIEKQYRELGGRITLLVKEGHGHYPLAPTDVAPVIEFILRSTS